MKQRKSREAGFSFIEILVVMGIISVLVSMVVGVIPFIQERSRRTKSSDNVRSMLMYFVDNRSSGKGWPGFNGKNFTLWLVARDLIDRRNPQNLEVLFSPGDNHYKLDDIGAKPYADVTLEALRTEGHDFKALTSYAGRRNKEKGHIISSSDESMGTLVLCDDDDGPLHHKDGMIWGMSNGSARFVPFDEMGISKPNNPDEPEGLLGENSPNESLKHMSSTN